MNWFRQLKVGAKIIIGFALMLFFVTVISIVGYKSVRNISGYLNSIFEKNLPGIDLLIETDRDLQQLLVAERSMIFENAQSDTFKSLVNEYETNLQQADERWQKYKKIASTPEELSLISKYESALKEWRAVSRQIVDGRIADTREGRRLALDLSLGQAKEKFEAMRAFLDQLTGINLKMAEDAHESSVKTSQNTLSTLLLSISLALVTGIALMWALTRGVTRPLKSIIDNLTEASAIVSAGSAQVSASSQSLAESASEQAATMEETSASLEEISSMTKGNADNASNAKSMMDQASQIVSKVDGHMTKLLAAMDEITHSSQETSKIIKTIDEIAFQTNLLALNAAVEAARAGEAGAGFAVVADEVRNLAMRAAEAAKTTSGLIDSTVSAIINGNILAKATQDAFKENIEIGNKVSALVGEIATASHEQANGIEQLNTATIEMDRVVQQVASSAEESASTVVEMEDQAEKLSLMIEQLVDMVGRNKDSQTAVPALRKKSRSKTLSVALPAPRRSRAHFGQKEDDQGDFEDF